MDTVPALALRYAVGLGLFAACAGPTRYDGGPAPQVPAGLPERFGPGIALARPAAIVLDLAHPGYVVVARFGAIEVGELVYPLDGADWQEFGYPARGAPVQPLAPGRHRLELPVPWLRVDVPVAARRGISGDGCRFKVRAWACTTWTGWRYQQNHVGAVYYGALPAPDSLAEHYLVVIVSAAPLDLRDVRARLDELHETRVSAADAARAAPQFLTARHDGEWAAFATTVRIQGVR